jgi:hypothetical protein
MLLGKPFEKVDGDHVPHPSAKPRVYEPSSTIDRRFPGCMDGDSLANQIGRAKRTSCDMIPTTLHS